MPTIDPVLDEFLASQRARLAARTYSRYEEIVELLRDSLNMYGFNSLRGDDEQERFQAAFDEGEEDAFTRSFGPEKIPEHYYEFLSYFLIRKVMASEDLLRRAGTVTKKLAAWLAEEGYIDPHLAEDAVEMGADAGRLLPRAERLCTILRRVMQASPPLLGELSDDGYYDDYALITNVEPGRIWFDERGPVAVPQEASDLAEVGWQVNVVLGRGPAGWQILELGNVYPM